LGNLLLIFSFLSEKSPIWVVLKKRNPAALIIAGIAFFLLALGVFFPPLRSFFHFELPGLQPFLPVVWAGLGLLLFLELLKLIKKRG